MKNELEAKNEELRIENERLKVVEAAMAQTSVERKGVEATLADLRTSLEERRGKEEALNAQIEELGKRVFELTNESKVKEDLIQSMRQTVATLHKVG
jgi:chromosome segregation ATPase